MTQQSASNHPRLFQYGWPALLALIACTLYAVLVGIGPLSGALLGLLAGAGLWYGLPWFSVDIRREKWLWLAPLGMAALLTVMILLPDSRLAKVHLVQPLVDVIGLPANVGRVGKAAENGYAAIMTFLLALELSVWLWSRVRRASIPEPARGGRRVGITAALLYAIPCLVVWSVYLYAYWPAVLSSDSLDQWSQLLDLRLLNDWHPVGHTLLEYALTRLWYSPAVVAIFQVLALALAWGCAMTFVESKGLRRGRLVALTWLFALLPPNGILLVTLWKDVLYAIANFLVVLMLGITWYTRGTWLRLWVCRLGLGAALALTYLMRHNGLLVLLLVPPALLIVYPKQWRSILVTAGLAAGLVLGIRGGLAFSVLHAKPNEEAVNYLMPIQHIDAVVASGGQLSQAEQTTIEQLAPIQIWRKAYNPYMADNLTKPWGIQKDPLVFEKIRANKARLLSTFLDLTRRYPSVVLRSELDITSMIWRVTFPSQFYRDYSLEYVEITPPIAPWVPNQQTPLFAQPNLASPPAQFLSRLLLFSNEQPLAYVLLWEGGVYLFLSAAFAVYGAQSQPGSGDFLLLLVPSLANVLSLAAAMPGQNYRFIYPLVLPAFLIVTFAFLCRSEAAA